MRSASNQGFTLLESVLVLTVISVMSIMVAESLQSLAKTQAFNRGQTRITEVADGVVRAVTWDVTSSTRVFGNDALGRGYFAAMDLGTLAAIPGSRLPLLTNRGWFEKDEPGANETGNVLFVGTALEPLTVDLAEADEEQDLVRVDRLRFVVYLVWQDLLTQDFARWASVPLVRYSDVASVADPVRRTKIWRKVYEQGLRYAWDPDQDRARGLYAVHAGGTATLLLPAHRVECDRSETRRALAGTRQVAIARNGSVPGAVVPAFANLSGGNGPFPGGFEVKVDGPASGRMVMIRLVLSSVIEHGMTSFAEVARLVSCHDG